MHFIPLQDIQDSPEAVVARILSVAAEDDAESEEPDDRRDR
jgi:hypothetical protein